MTAQPAVEIDNLSKLYTAADGRTGGGLRSASFEVAEGELFTLLGPSGCGKTTTLRAIAGLETPDTGRIAIGGREMFNAKTRSNVALHDRDVGMVFQSYAIWPHMSVFENAAYPLRVSRKPRYTKQQIAEKTQAVLERVGLGPFASRPATQLSGGQQQRLALARALAREPRLLLLDEPLSNLDAQLREQMRVELKRLQRETGVTAVYVTHDQTEALAISDRIAVLRDGIIAQIGTPKEIYARPNSEFVANFVGRSNLLRGVVAQNAAPDHEGVVDTAAGRISCLFRHSAASGTDITVLIRPENITIAGMHDAAAQLLGNRLTGRLIRESYLGEANDFVASVAGSELLVRSSASGLTAGDEVTLSFAPGAAIALPPGPELEAAGGGG